MADAIPSADAALLAAQAKGGQAGVDAYNAAKQELMNQRQSAVQQAMQEAALRGAPINAIPSIQSTITSPYDQGIADMTAGGAAAAASSAAADRRMSDYSAAVNAARSFIPQMVEMQVAPIRAQGEYNVRQQQIRGDQAVNEINANERLTEAKMQAAFQAWQIQQQQAAQKQSAQDAKLNQGQLSAQLGNDTLSYLTNLADQVTSDINTQTRIKGKAADMSAALNPFVAGQVNDAKTEAWGKQLGAMILQAAIERDNKRLGATATFQDPLGGARVAAGDIAAQAAGRSTPAESFGATATQAYQKIARLLGESQAAKQRAQQIPQDAGARMIQTTPLGILSPQQVSQFSPDQLGILQGAGRPFNTPADVQEMILGAPIATTDQTTGATSYSTNPYAATAFQLAGRLAGANLQQQGYDVTDQDILQALGVGQNLGAGTTAYDLNQGLTNQPTSGQQIKSQVAQDDASRAQARQDTKDQIAAMDAQTKANETKAEQDYFNQFGTQWPSQVGTAVQVNALINQFYNQFYAAKTAAQKALGDLRKKGNYTQSDEEDKIRQALTQQGVPDQPGLYEILRDQLL